MIPKKIHYCWLSGDPIPSGLQECIDSWKIMMPDYEIILWDQNKFNIESVLFVKEACAAKKWAFAADYIRLYALYTEGGIYLDSDVFVTKKLDCFLKYDFFSSVEFHERTVEQENSSLLLNEHGFSKIPGTSIPGIGIQAAVIGSIKKNFFIKECLGYYDSRHFILESGAYHDNPIAPGIMAMSAEKYGFKYIDKEQYIGNNSIILPSVVFSGQNNYDPTKTYAIHYCAGSWRERNKLKKLLTKLKNNSYIRNLFNKSQLDLSHKIKSDM